MSAIGIREQLASSRFGGTLTQLPPDRGHSSADVVAADLVTAAPPPGIDGRLA